MYGSQLSLKITLHPVLQLLAAAISINTGSIGLRKCPSDIKGDILCFSVSFNLQMMLQSRTAVLNDAKV